MFSSLYWAISDHSPQLRRLLRRWGYDYLAGRFQHDDWTFMNFGYAAPEPNPSKLSLWSSDEPDRLHIELYHRVIGPVVLHGRDILEIGCGRGGGASYVARYFRPRSMVGIDFSIRVVGFCLRRHAVAVLKFCVGDAEALPIRDASFDAVVNIESSHCYASMPRFLGQVRRVLRPGGHLMFADLRSRRRLPLLIEQIRTSGMHIVDAEDITRSVVKALDLDSARKREIIRRRAPRVMQSALSWFVGVAGTRTYQALSQGHAVYLRYVLSKPGVSANKD